MRSYRLGVLDRPTILKIPVIPERVAARGGAEAHDGVSFDRVEQLARLVGFRDARLAAFHDVLGAVTAAGRFLEKQSDQG